LSVPSVRPARGNRARIEEPAIEKDELEGEVISAREIASTSASTSEILGKGADRRRDDREQGRWTAARYRIDATFVILNNTSYRILKQRLHNMRGIAEQVDSYVGMELLDPKIDFVGLARSLGIKAERAKTVHEATDLLAQSIKGGGATLIDVELDRAFKPM